MAQDGHQLITPNPMAHFFFPNPVPTTTTDEVPMSAAPRALFATLISLFAVGCGGGGGGGGEGSSYTPESFIVLGGHEFSSIHAAELSRNTRLFNTATNQTLYGTNDANGPNSPGAAGRIMTLTFATSSVAGVPTVRLTMAITNPSVSIVYHFAIERDTLTDVDGVYLLKRTGSAHDFNSANGAAPVLFLDSASTGEYAGTCPLADTPNQAVIYSTTVSDWQGVDTDRLIYSHYTLSVGEPGYNATSSQTSGAWAWSSSDGLIGYADPSIPGFGQSTFLNYPSGPG